jgi:hypothetical protein
MNYKLFGKSGLRVSELSLGTMGFGTEWKWGADKELSQKIFDTYAQAGGNFLDTDIRKELPRNTSVILSPKTAIILSSPPNIPFATAAETSTLPGITGKI